ncbi:putative lipoprotein [Burkholderia pseudomallei]|nr:putative lipoprotein [Burkholderia pseudomallei]
MKTLIAAICVAVLLAGCSDSHLKVKLTHNTAFPDIPRLRLTAVDQDVTVSGIKVNDGDCPLNMLERFPRTIPKGSSDTVDILSSCDAVKSVAIKTDDGTFNFSF